MLILGLCGGHGRAYAWLTSAVNPEEGMVRIAIMVAMAGMLVVALTVPEAFDTYGGLFAGAYAVVRVAHIGLFIVASRGEPAFRHSVLAGIGGSTALSVGLLVVASFTDGAWQFALFGDRAVARSARPLLLRLGGMELAPGHFAERHGLIIIIALGESIVAIGVGAEVGLDTGEVVAAVLGVGVAAALWWLYFDVVALVAERRLINAAEGRERNEIARDSYSYLHLPMVAGIVLLALGLKKTLGDVDHALKIEPAFALLGGTAIYLFAHVAFRWRNVHTFSKQRFACGLVLLALIPAGVELPSLATLAILFALLVILIVYETMGFAERRDQIRHQLSEATP